MINSLYGFKYNYKKTFFSWEKIFLLKEEKFIISSKTDMILTAFQSIPQWYQPVIFLIQQLKTLNIARDVTI